MWSYRLEFSENNYFTADDSLSFPLSLQSADPNHGSTPKETPHTLSRIGVEYGKIGSGHTKPAISPKRLKIE